MSTPQDPRTPSPDQGWTAPHPAGPWPGAPAGGPQPPPPWGQGGFGWGAPPRPPAFSGMAVTALVLSVLLFPAGLVLGILALTRLGVPPRRGKGLAVTAVVVASAQILALAVVVPVAAFRAGRDGGADRAGGEPGGDRPGPTEIDVFDIRVGDCFDSGVGLGNFGEDVGEMTVTRLPCDGPHEAEAYATTRVEGYDAFPGDAELSETSGRACVDLMGDYVLDLWTLPYEVAPYSYYPGPDSWQQGDREVLCFLGHDGGPELTGSLRGDAGALDPEQRRYLEITMPLELGIWNEPPPGEPLPERRDWARDMAGIVAGEIEDLSAGEWSGQVAALVPDLVAARETSLRHWRDAADATGAAGFEAAVESGYALLGVDHEVAVRDALGLPTGVW
ncbi:septum formation family protein [Streptomyces sp. URMC 129]|uniref:septum formation family protein n=1 Tax=Streptomyces sp. URMC 129 TaxID=3423407 RepID=UPI003F19B547